MIKYVYLEPIVNLKQPICTRVLHLEALNVEQWYIVLIIKKIWTWVFQKSILNMLHRPLTRRKLKYDKVYMYIYLKPIVNLKRTTYTRVLHLKALNVGQ